MCQVASAGVSNLAMDSGFFAGVFAGDVSLPEPAVDVHDEELIRFGEKGSYKDPAKTDGWLGAVRNKEDPNSCAFGFVFGMRCRGRSLTRTLCLSRMNFMKSWKMLRGVTPMKVKTGRS